MMKPYLGLKINPFSQFDLFQADLAGIGIDEKLAFLFGVNRQGLELDITPTDDFDIFHAHPFPILFTQHLAKGLIDPSGLNGAY